MMCMLEHWEATLVLKDTGKGKGEVLLQHDITDWCHTCATCYMEDCFAQKSCTSPNHRGRLLDASCGGRHNGFLNSCVLVARGYFTNWTEEVAMVVRKLTDKMFCRFSPPEQLHSDQRRQFGSKYRQFKSELMQEVCKLLQVRKTRTTPYHPQCDSLVE